MDHPWFFITVLTILSIPIIFRILLTSRVRGKLSRRNSTRKHPNEHKHRETIQRLQLLGHVLQGFLVGICMSPTEIISDELWMHTLRAVIVVLFGLFYAYYNLIKRALKTRIDFFESSFFENMTHFVVGLSAGYFIGAIVSYNRTGKFSSVTGFDLSGGVQAVMIAALLLWLSIVMSLSFISKREFGY